MKAPTAARLAWSLCVACVVGVGGSIVLQVLNGTAGLGISAPARRAGVLRRWCPGGCPPDTNPVGWLLLAAGLCLAVPSFDESYARYTLVTAPGSLPGAMVAAWAQVVQFGLVAILAIFLPLYFPTGRLLSPRWRPILWSGIGYLLFAVVGNVLQPGPQEWLPGAAAARNPVVYLPAGEPLGGRCCVSDSSLIR
jgi:hypothetical protein